MAPGAGAAALMGTPSGGRRVGVLMGWHGQAKLARVSGARSALWRQILADVLGTEVATVNVTQGAAFGAAVLAGVGAGVFENVTDATHSIVRETGVTSPGPDADGYRGAYERYRALYPALHHSR